MKPILLVPLVVLLVGCSRKAHELEKPVTPVRVATVTMYQAKTGERYSASITPGRQVTLSFRVSGFVRQLHQVQANSRSRSLEPGDTVPQGTILARLRREDYSYQVQQAKGQAESARRNQEAARAQLAQGQAGQIKAQADFTRAKALFESQSMTRSDFDAAKAQLDSTEAQVGAAQAQLEASMAQVHSAEAAMATAALAEQDTALVAPFPAAIVQRNVEIGMLVSPGAQAYTLADVSWVKATFGAPDSVAVQLKPGASVSVAVEALPGHNFRGNITAIAAVADAETRLFQTEVSLANPDRMLRPGMIATLSLGQAAATEPVPVVPLSSVVRDQRNSSGFAVMVLDGKVARARSIVLGPTYGDMLAVTSGVKPGDQVIRAGATLVADGETVEVIP